MAMMVAISPGTLILLLSIQNILAQQYLNNIGLQNTAGAPQQTQKTTCGLNQMAQNSGLNYNPIPSNMQQVNFQQQPSNIQQAPPTQQAGNPQTQLNVQQTNSQPPASSISNSELLQQQNPNLASNIFSALHNIKQSSQNQGINFAKTSPTQQNNYEQSYHPQFQNQLSPTFTISTPIINNPSTINPPSSVPASFAEYQQFQPAFTVQAVPSNNVPYQQNQQMFSLPVQKSYTNGQNQDYSIQGQPIPNSVSSQQARTIQSPMAMVSGAQANTAQSQPLVLRLTPPMTSVQSQTTMPTSYTSQSQPIIYTVQTQPSTIPNQNQQIVSNPPQPTQQGSNNAPTDNQSLISYVMSQMQNQQGNNNALGSILPAMLNTKSEKSLNMKSLLPLIFNMLNERSNGCVCPHCGCNNNNQNTQEPHILSGYANQKNYSQLEPIEEVVSKITEDENKSLKSTSGITKKNKFKIDDITNKSAEISEEDEEEEEEADSEEDYDEE